MFEIVEDDDDGCRSMYYCVKSDIRFLIFGENFLLLEGRKSIFLSASSSQFVAKGPAKILKISHWITFLWPK